MLENVNVEFPVIDEKRPLFTERSLVETRKVESEFVFVVENVRVEFPVIDEKSPLFTARSLVEIILVRR